MVDYSSPVDSDVTDEDDYHDATDDHSSIALATGTHTGHGETVALSDWSQTGRGSHVDFEKDEVAPLEQGTWSALTISSH
jgi:hypothetical protein